MSRLKSMLDAITRSETTGIPHQGAGWTGIGAMPEVGPHAYRHVIFAPLEDRQREQLLAQAPIGYPPEVHRYLSVFNGAVFYQGGLAILGLAEGMNRDPVYRQPFDLQWENHLKANPSASSDRVIGSLDEDGSLLWLSGSAPRVFRRLPAQPAILEEWPDLDSMMEAVLDRLAREFGIAWATRDTLH